MRLTRLWGVIERGPYTRLDSLQSTACAQRSTKFKKPGFMSLSNATWRGRDLLLFPVRLLRHDSGWAEAEVEDLAAAALPAKTGRRVRTRNEESCASPGAIGWLRESCRTIPPTGTTHSSLFNNLSRVSPLKRKSSSRS